VKKKEISNMFWVILGVVFFSLGYRWFLFPAGLYSGGFTGAAQLIKDFLLRVVGIQVPNSIDLTGIIFWCINIPLFILGYKSLGTKFFYRTIIAVCIQSLLLTWIPAPKKPIFSDELLNCIIGGVVSGSGVGITLRAGGSGGGLDILGMYCAKRYPDFSVGKISAMMNAGIYFIAALRYNIEVAAYSLVFSIIAAVVLDHVHYQNIKVCAFVVTKNKSLGESINRCVSRGVTSWSGWGEFSHQEENIHMIVISKYELQTLKNLIHQMDPDAFVLIVLPEMIWGHFEKRLEVR